MQHAPAYKDPDFGQSLPDGYSWTLSEVQPFFGALLYVDRANDKRAVVPNIWYNQPVDRRIAAVNYYAERADESATRLESDAFAKPWQLADVVKYRADAARLRSLAEEMERTRRVLA